MYDRGEITEEDLNSEVELLKSQDLLRLVVTKLGLQNSEHLFFAGAGDQEERKIARAVKKLSKQIVVKPVQKTALLTVSYRSSDPAKAHSVLETLAQLYLDKHIKVHRPSGQFTFFDAQADHYGEELRQAEDKLTQFTRDENVVSAAQERDIALQHLSEFELASDKTKAENGRAHG